MSYRQTEIKETFAAFAKTLLESGNSVLLKYYESLKSLLMPPFTAAHCSVASAAVRFTN